MKHGADGPKASLEVLKAEEERTQAEVKRRYAEEEARKAQAQLVSAKAELFGMETTAGGQDMGSVKADITSTEAEMRAIEQEEADEMGWGVYNSPTDTTRYCDMDRQAYRDCNTQMNNAIHQIMMEKYREQEEDLHRDQLCVVQYLTPVLRTEFSNIHMFYLNNPNMNYSHSLFYENMKFVYLWTVPQKLDVSEINQ